jgi:hypothetical protein
MGHFWVENKPSGNPDKQIHTCVRCLWKCISRWKHFHPGSSWFHCTDTNTSNTLSAYLSFFHSLSLSVCHLLHSLTYIHTRTPSLSFLHFSFCFHPLLFSLPFSCCHFIRLLFIVFLSLPSVIFSFFLSVFLSLPLPLSLSHFVLVASTREQATVATLARNT